MFVPEDKRKSPGTGLPVAILPLVARASLLVAVISSRGNHRDILDLPRGATLLASSAPTARQAFRYGKNAYGLLFHMEVTFLSVDSTVSNTLTKVAKHLDSEAERLEGERPSEPDWDGDRSTAASHREIDIDELFRDL